MSVKTADPKNTVAAFAAVAITVLLWASAFVVIRSAGEYFSAGPLALGRLVVGALALGVTSVIRRQGWPPRAAWPGIAVSGVLWFGVYFVALNWGEQKIDAGTASMLVNIGPILIALLSGWLLKDAIPPRAFAGLIVSFGGAVVVGFAMSGHGKESVVGVLLCLVAAASYAGGVVAQKPALKHASALQVTSFGCAVGATCCLPFTGTLIAQIGRNPLSANLDIIYLGIFPTALAFTTWAYALSRTTATNMGATTYIVPVLTVLLAWALLGQAPPWLSLAGGALCLIGVGVTRSKLRLAWWRRLSWRLGTGRRRGGGSRRLHRRRISASRATSAGVISQRPGAGNPTVYPTTWAGRRGVYGRPPGFGRLDGPGRDVDGAGGCLGLGGLPTVWAAQQPQPVGDDQHGTALVEQQPGGQGHVPGQGGRVEGGDGGK